MFALYQNGMVPGAHNAWTAWSDKILEKKAKFGFTKVAMVTTGGEVLWFTGKFLPTSQEIQVFNRLFAESADQPRTIVPGVDRITVHGSTYIAKAIPDDARSPTVKQFVAFSGDKYVLISRSNTIYVVVLAEAARPRGSSTWLTDSLGWLAKLCHALMRRNY